MRDDHRMEIDGSYPFRGMLRWLSPEEGGRRSGPPRDPRGYASIAHIPPATARDGSASFVLRNFTLDAMISPAEGRWLIVDNEGEFTVSPGTEVVVTEGTRPVAIFLVEEVVPTA